MNARCAKFLHKKLIWATVSGWIQDFSRWASRILPSEWGDAVLVTEWCRGIKAESRQWIELFAVGSRARLTTFHRRECKPLVGRDADTQKFLLISRENYEIKENFVPGGRLGQTLPPKKNPPLNVRIKLKCSVHVCMIRLVIFPLKLQHLHLLQNLRQSLSAIDASAFVVDSALFVTAEQFLQVVAPLASEYSPTGHATHDEPLL